MPPVHPELMNPHQPGMAFKRRFKCPILSEEDKFTSCETAGPADQLTPVDAFEITWDYRTVAHSIIMWICIVLCVALQPGITQGMALPVYFLIGTFIIYYVYICDCAWSKTLKYLNNVITFEELVQHIRVLRQDRPRFLIHVHTYHSSGDDKSSTIVTTVSEIIDFPYDESEDLTRFDFAGMTLEDLIPPEGGGGHLVLVDLPQFLCMNSTMSENYDRLTGEKYEQNKDRDTNIAVYSTWTHHEERLLMLKQDFLVSKRAYWLCSVLGLSIPYRIFFQLKTDKMVLPIRMKVS